MRKAKEKVNMKDSEVNGPTANASLFHYNRI